MQAKEFVNTLFGRLRAFYDKNNEVWFYGNDVCDALGYKNAADAIRVHTSENDSKTLTLKDCRESRESILWENANDFRPKVLINESGLYCLIFGSKLDSARLS